MAKSLSWAVDFVTLTILVTRGIYQVKKSKNRKIALNRLQIYGPIGRQKIEAAALGNLTHPVSTYDILFIILIYVRM